MRSSTIHTSLFSRPRCHNKSNCENFDDEMTYRNHKPLPGGQTYADQCIQKAKGSSNNPCVTKDIYNCVYKNNMCFNENYPNKTQNCLSDTLDWAKNHCHSRPIYPPSPDNRPKPGTSGSKSSRNGERYAEECIKENEAKTGNKCSFKTVSTCVADKCYENDDDYTNDCTLAGTVWAQKYCN